MALSRFVLPYQTVIDPSGEPLPGALLFFYYSGTDIPLDTYNDPLQTAPNTNPVVANAAGMFPSIFMQSVNYKVVLTDETGDQIWTADPVNGAGGGGGSGDTFPTTAAMLLALGQSQVLADGAIFTTAGRDTETDRGGATFYYNASDTTTLDNGGTVRVDEAGHRFYILWTAAVKAAWFGAKGDGLTDDTAAIQAAHDFVEGELGGAVELIAGAQHVVNGGLIWDCRLVALHGLGATLDAAGSIPVNVGLNLVTGDNSTFLTGTGNWVFTGGTTMLVAGGVSLANTGAVAAYGTLAMVTTPGAWYAVSYTEVNGSGGAQMNVYADLLPDSDTLGYDTDTNTGWFLFQATNIATYLTMRVSTTNAGDSATVGSILVQQSVPPTLTWRDLSNQFAYPITSGLGYRVGDILTVLGGSFSAQAQITVYGVDLSGRITKAQIHAAGTYTAFPPNPVQTSGGSGSGASFNIGISTPQFGHEAYPLREFLMTGPGRNTGYTVDAVTPFSIYSSSSCSFGINMDSTQVAGNRNSTSSRGSIKNVTMRNYWAGVCYNDQAYLSFLYDVGISNCNFGFLVVSGQNAGENNTVYAGWVTGCDINACADAHSLKFDHTSLDFPKQATIRMTGDNASLVLNECHIEQSPPGQSTQLVAPISLTGKAATLYMVGGELQITGGYIGGSFNEIIATSLGNQYVILDGVQMNNLITTYLASGPANIQVPTPSRFLQFPAIPATLNDQIAGSAMMDAFGFGGFEKPAVALSTNPSGAVAIGSSQDWTAFTQVYTGPYASDKMSIRLATAAFHSGAQSLRVVKANNSPTEGVVYFVAPARSGFQHWWTFWINVPAPATGGLNCVVNMTQDYVQSFGQPFIPIGASGSNNPATAPLGYEFNMTLPVPGLGQVFTGNQQGGIQISNVSGTGGWVQFQTDTFNHGTQKALPSCSHIYLQLDFSGFDGASWGPISAYIDDVFCWQL